jgi:hypothetical protein
VPIAPAVEEIDRSFDDDNGDDDDDDDGGGGPPRWPFVALPPASRRESEKSSEAMRSRVTIAVDVDVDVDGLLLNDALRGRRWWSCHAPLKRRFGPPPFGAET